MIKVVFFGTEDISVPSLESLISSDKYEVVGVVTKPDSARGRGHKVDSPAVAKVAREYDIQLFQPNKLKDIVDDLAALHADVGALVSYGKMIPDSIINLFPHGIVNFHPSMLPVYRGPSPIETSIMNGDSFTGLTLMSVQKDMDAGPIYYQERVELNGTEAASDLYARFGKRGGELFADKLDKIVSGEIKSLKQDDDLAVYCHMIKKEDGELDPTVMTAHECDQRIRAFNIWPRCRMDFAGQHVIVTKAKVLDDFMGDTWPDVVPCYRNTALQVQTIISPKSGKQMSASEFLRGLH